MDVEGAGPAGHTLPHSDALMPRIQTLKFGTLHEFAASCSPRTDVHLTVLVTVLLFDLNTASQIDRITFDNWRVMSMLDMV
jgi:hypothetical protein